MSKNNRSSTFNLSGVDPTAEISKHLNKKGKLSNCSKKERKALQSICPHQCVNRKGKIKPRIEGAGKKNGSEYVRCTICGEVYKAGFYTDMEYDKAHHQYKEILSQAKMIGAALDVDRDRKQQIAETNLYVDNFGKLYKNMRKVAQKKEEVRTKKKKKKDNYRMGSWNVR